MRKFLPGLLILFIIFAVGILGSNKPVSAAIGLSQKNFRFLNFHQHSPLCGTERFGDVRCHARLIVDDQGKPAASMSTPSGYGPAQLAGAYGLTGKSAGGRTLAIVDAYDQPNIKTDLDTYNATFGLPAFSGLTKVDQNGGTNYPAVNSGWALETSLDVEAAHAACPDCKLLLVEANSASYSDLMTAVDRAVSMGATVVSNSYGSREFSGETTFDSHFNHPGVAFVFSSGDSGYGTSYPAASRLVTSAGGTSLYINPDNTWNSEFVWSGTGSGCSSIETKPSFQHDTGCFRRTLNDVAADADPYAGAAVYDSVPYSGQTGWFQVGGTSLAAPIISAAYALGGVPTGIQANSLSYINTSALHDVTSGSNGNCRRSQYYLCHGVSGYDGPTGFGTPNGTAAF